VTHCFWGMIMCAIILLCINQHMEFEARSFTYSKDMIGSKFKQLAQLSLMNPRDMLHHGKWQNFKTVT